MRTLVLLLAAATTLVSQASRPSSRAVPERPKEEIAAFRRQFDKEIERLSKAETAPKEPTSTQLLTPGVLEEWKRRHLAWLEREEARKVRLAELKLAREDGVIALKDVEDWKRKRKEEEAARRAQEHVAIGQRRTIRSDPAARGWKSAGDCSEYMKFIRANDLDGAALHARNSETTICEDGTRVILIEESLGKWRCRLASGDNKDSLLWFPSYAVTRWPLVPDAQK